MTKESIPQSTHPPSEEYDSPWKIIIEAHFQEFMEFFFPNMASAIDWAMPAEFLNTELEKIVRNAHEGKRYADKLVKVHTRDHRVTFVYIHVEIQAAREKSFAKRMFLYNSRISERFGDSVCSLAILADNSPEWKPTSFERRSFESLLSFTFPVVKLLELDERCREPAGNPFAWVVRAHLDSQATRGQGEARLLCRMAATRALYAAGFSAGVVHNVMAFLDWVLTLPQELASGFDDFVKELEIHMGKPYVPTWERKALAEGIQLGVQQGRQEGRQEGRQQGRQEADMARIAQALEKRLQGESQTFVGQLCHLTAPEREELFNLMLDTTDAAVIRAWFAARPEKTSGN